MSQPYSRTNEDRRKAVGGFLGALIGNPVAQGVVSPELGIAQLARGLANNVNVDMSTGPGPISRQQAGRRQEQAGQQQANDLAGRQQVQAWLDGLRQSGQIDPNNPNPPAGIDKAASRGNIFQNVAHTIADPRGGNLTRQSTGAPGQPQGFTGTSFANMATQAAQQQERGQELPFQGMTPNEAQASFNRGSPGQGTTRLTDWDTEMPYRVVSQLTPEDYTDLESITDKSELIETGADTVLNVLEMQGTTLPEGFEERFKGGIGKAMDDWYAQRSAEGGSLQMTDFMMGMTQIASALLSQEPGVAAPTSTGQVAHDGMTINPGDPGAAMITAPDTGQITEEQFIEMYQAGQIPTEFIAGFNAAVKANPNLTIEAYLRGER